MIVNNGVVLRVLLAMAEKSKELETKMNMAIVDGGGNLKMFLSEEGSWIGSIDIAIKKAKTSLYFQMDSSEIGKLSQPGGSLFGIEHSNGGLITFAGGVILHNPDGSVSGAIGVSGSTIENDAEVAQAGRNEFILVGEEIYENN